MDTNRQHDVGSVREQAPGGGDAGGGADAPSKAEILRAVLAEFEAGEPAALLAPLLFSRPPAEDLAPFAISTLARAARAAASVLTRHRPGEPVIAVERLEGMGPGGGALGLVTVANDDMAFLFDSVTAELADTAAAVHFVSHPILDATRDETGLLVGFSASHAANGAGASTDAPSRVSLIQLGVDLPDASAAESLAERLAAILSQVRRANEDFGAMRGRVSRAVAAIRARAASLPTDAAGIEPGGYAADLEEAASLLEWLRDDNFIFLGIREYDYVPDGGEEALRRREEGGLGILADPSVNVLRRDGRPLVTTPEIRAFLEAPAPIIVTKANMRSVVHRRAYMDYVGVKLFEGEGGRLSGEMRLVGLFSSSAYNRSILEIPYLRLKANTVIARSGLRPGSHSAKALLNALESYPRDDLFQIDVERLERFSSEIVTLGERPRTRVLARVDKFDRFVSLLVFVPRDRYDSRLRERIGALLADAYDGHVSAYYPAFPEGFLARVHFIVGRRGGPTPQVDVSDLEIRIAELARTFDDAFLAALRAARADPELARILPGLPASYREEMPLVEAVGDVATIASLNSASPLGLDFFRREGLPDHVVGLKINHLGEPVVLSRRVPVLENMGFSVIAERTHAIRRPDRSEVYLHEMALTLPGGGAIPLEDAGLRLEETFAAVWAGRVENDLFNALVLEAGFTVAQANVLRAYARYLRQASGGGASFEALGGALRRNPAIARLLWQLFDASLNPALAKSRGESRPGDEASVEPEERFRAVAARRGAQAPYAAILEALDAVDSLDDDRAIRRFAGAILATLRTNFYAVSGLSTDEASEPGRVDPALAFKLDPALVEGLPEPVPYREIFVFDGRVEGVHLRFGAVARGGLRWSDRREDYRTEILGLVKAQQVKNAVIVPVGAKGGFYPKRLPDPAADREAWAKAGRAAYVVFVDSLLSVTDDIEGERVEPPALVARHDGDDPYFVVAADKGTATFSDTANAISQARGFWLDDAFASGGSAGYDHKAMGITARGAWEAVKRHFREIGRDIQREPFTVAGCGDMSGDVFGNGMLLSEQTRLLAAFDHRDIFIDPDPDAATSFAERRRLFALPRSSWQDYDRSKLSAGAMIVSRREKEVRLTPEAAAAIGWTGAKSATPTEIITAILKSPVDLLWFGGIGTYVRASTESNAEVGDRANDGLRVTGREIRARIVGEGANLGVTQKGRIEFARAGGRINSDAIDNSAGVNTSDVEVNIKIAFKGPLDSGRIDRPERDALLKDMTDEVARLVLANNYEQTLAISVEERAGAAALPLQGRFMTALEETGRLKRDLEALPSDAVLAERRGAGRGLTRPEIGVLLAYSKIKLFDALVASDLGQDPYLAGRLHAYFPGPMRQRFAAEIDNHRLAREIVCTQLANEAVNRLGPTFVTELRDASGVAPGGIVRAFVAAADGFDAGALKARIDALDGRIDGGAQNEFYEALTAFLRRLTRWFVRNERFETGIGPAVEALRAVRRSVGDRLPELATERAQGEFAEREASIHEKGAPDDLARDLALLPLLALLPDIAAVSRETGVPLERTVSGYFTVTRHFRIGRLEGALASLKPTDYYESLALARAGAEFAGARRRLAVAALSAHPEADNPAEAWSAAQGPRVGQVIAQIAALAGAGEASVSRLTVAAGLLSDLSAG